MILREKTFSPTKLSEVLLAEYNVKRTPESITMWLSRHPDIVRDLKGKVVEEELPKEVVVETIFSNGTFEQLPSVKQWIMQMEARELSQDYMNQRIGEVKNACKGQYKNWNLDLVLEGLWSFKHPDRLTVKDALELISILKKRGKDTCRIKGALKDFIESKGKETVGKKFAVGKPKGFGKFAKLFVEAPILKEMLEWIRNINLEAYVADEFMYKTGTRIEATLASLIENFAEVEDKAIQTVYDKGRRSKYPKGHPWDKRCDAQLTWEMKQLIGDRGHGKIFNISADTMAKLNREAIEKFAPEVLQQYPDLMPNHFWRHMFFQHILRRCNWNYKVAGALGGATSQSVEESYGEPPDQVIKKWSEEFTINI